MAYDKIIPIKSRLDHCVSYVLNHEKTGLSAALSYIGNEGKTTLADGSTVLETAINCRLETAYQEMQDTKKRWGKPGGVLGYHLIHAFAPGEVKPEQAHALGVEFAGKLLGNRYEAVISTHLDRDHIHCHIVFNSVSCVDGRKYGTFLCHGGLPVCGILPGAAKAGVCPAAFHPLCRSKSGRRICHGYPAGHLGYLQRYRHQRHVQRGRFCLHDCTLPSEIVSAIEDVGFLESIPLWLVSLLGSLIVTVLSFILILTVYGRFFRLFMYTALAPLPLSAFAGEGTSAHGITFLKSYIGVCMEGAVIVLACLIYSAFLSSSAPVVHTLAAKDFNRLFTFWRKYGIIIITLL